MTYPTTFPTDTPPQHHTAIVCTQHYDIPHHLSHWHTSTTSYSYSVYPALWHTPPPFPLTHHTTDSIQHKTVTKRWRRKAEQNVIGKMSWEVGVGGGGWMKGNLAWQIGKHTLRRSDAMIRWISAWVAAAEHSRCWVCSCRTVRQLARISASTLLGWH